MTVMMMMIDLGWDGHSHNAALLVKILSEVVQGVNAFLVKVLVSAYRETLTDDQISHTYMYVYR